MHFILLSTDIQTHMYEKVFVTKKYLECAKTLCNGVPSSWI